MEEIELVMTCGACPEQYDAFYNGSEVGYLRLRHGSFSVYCEGEEVYSAQPKGDGIFEPDERDYYLNQARIAIYNAIHGIDEKRMLIDGFINEIKEEFSNQNWDYLSFIADRYLGKDQ